MCDKPWLRQWWYVGCLSYLAQGEKLSLTLDSLVAEKAAETQQLFLCIVYSPCWRASTYPNNPPSIPHPIPSFGEESQLQVEIERKHKVNSGLFVSSEAPTLQDPITSEGPRSRQHSLYSHSSSKASNGGCKKVLEISRGPQLVAYSSPSGEGKKGKTLILLPHPPPPLPCPPLCPLPPKWFHMTPTQIHPAARIVQANVQNSPLPEAPAQNVCELADCLLGSEGWRWGQRWCAEPVQMGRVFLWSSCHEEGLRVTIRSVEQERGLASPSELGQSWTDGDDKIAAILPKKTVENQN